MTELEHINYDCRVTDNTDFFNNVKFLDHCNDHTFKSIFLNVNGFPATDYYFRQIEMILQRLSAKGGCATILTEEHIDDTMYDLLMKNNYDYVGTATYQTALPPYIFKPYDIFNGLLVNDVLVTIGCLQRNV
uniref:Uncharacterized protein n=1 Tax=Panagrolaimus superbus TaxID=310955 RepID=A0A914YTZ2_9BILA